MPPQIRSSNQTFNISLLDVETLDSPGGLETALRSIESLCFQADSVIAGMVMGLSSRSHILEYVFSGMSCAGGCLRVSWTNRFLS